MIFDVMEQQKAIFLIGTNNNNSKIIIIYQDLNGAVILRWDVMTRMSGTGGS
jgi:hypothetical protein